MNEEMMTKLEDLCADEKYIEYLVSLGNAEKISEALSEKGVDLDAEELRKIGTLATKKQNGELSDEELAEVAGGDPVALPILAAIVVIAAVCVIADKCS